jgi:hypothetical protein
LDAVWFLLDSLTQSPTQDEGKDNEEKDHHPAHDDCEKVKAKRKGPDCDVEDEFFP